MAGNPGTPVTLVFLDGHTEGIVCSTVELRDESLVLTFADGTKRTIALSLLRTWRYS